MKYYTSTIPIDLAEKLKEKGMPIDSYPLNTLKYARFSCPSYAEVFDWLISNKQITLVVEPSFYESYLSKIYNKDRFVKGFDGNSWHEAANTAIENILSLI